MRQSPVLVTSSIAYVNGDPHIGFAMEVIQADTYARWLKSRGHEVRLITGTDDHGQKIQKLAEKRGVTPQALTDTYAPNFMRLMELLNIEHDHFTRTTDPQHQKGAQAMWQALKKAGALEKRNFQGWYCVGCEAFLTEADMTEDGLCKIHGTRPEWVTEENVFFLMSQYQGGVEKALQAELRVEPDFRKREVEALMKEGLKDVSFSREKAKLSWGIPVPDEEDQVMYVWCDALTNYLTGVGYPDGDWKDYWGNGKVVHFIGKDIVRFHCAIWPSMLMAAGISLPSAICVHGFLTSEGKKMSKSLGNVVDPFQVVEKTGGVEDALRFYLLHEVPIGRDADYTEEKYAQMYQAFCVNGVGNLTQRLLTLCQKQGVQGAKADTNSPLQGRRESLTREINEAMEGFQFHIGIGLIRQALEEINERLSQTEPWKLYKEDEGASRKILADCLESFGLVAREMWPFVPRTAQRVTEAIESMTPPEKMFLQRKELGL